MSGQLRRPQELFYLRITSCLGSKAFSVLRGMGGGMALIKQDKQYEGNTLDSVEVVSLCKKNRCKVISSFSNYTHSSK